MNPIIALWCHPRSMSSAMERIMRERGDCACFHEPFLYDYYVHRAVRPMPHFEPDPAKPAAYGEIRDRLLAAAARGPVFFKDMAYYVVPAIFDDADFADAVTHTFLIRNPARSILSYYRLDPAVTCEEIGYEAQWRLVDWLEARYGETPPIVEAEAIRRDPNAAMRAYWTRLGLDDAPHAFEWDPDEMPEGWDEVAGWHGAATSHGMIRPAQPDDEADATAEFEAAARAAPHLADYMAHHLPYYERLSGRAMRPA